LTSFVVSYRLVQIIHGLTAMTGILLLKTKTETAIFTTYHSSEVVLIDVLHAQVPLKLKTRCYSTHALSPQLGTQII